MKKGNYLLIVVVAFLAFGSVSCTYYTNPAEPEFIIPPPTPAYIGSEGCANCHQDIYNTFRNSGHPYILSEVKEGVPPTLPNTTLDYIPAHFASGWNDVSYVIGGFAWKYQFIDDEGYIYTGNDAQYNLKTSAAVPYHADVAPGTKEFSCGKCHTTGWESTQDGALPQDGLMGMGGSFFAAGVQCEACHGMGSIHAGSRSAEDIIIDTEALACGSCHSRNEDHSIAAADGFILNYTQYDELISSGHKNLSCVACHDPHASVKHGQTGGIVKSCTECHTNMKNPTHNGADCVTCHMPYATKSATSVNKYVGDVQTHIFKINTAENGQMFNEAGTVANGSDGVTLGYVCYQCHKDEDNVGGNNSHRTLRQLSSRARTYHN
jgi:hypothetical protein